MQVAIGFVGNYAPNGLSPQMYDMPVIQKKQVAPHGATCLILKPCHFERAKRLRNLNDLCSDFSHTLEMTMNGHDKKLLPVSEQIHELFAGLCLIESTAKV